MTITLKPTFGASITLADTDLKALAAALAPYLPTASTPVPTPQPTPVPADGTYWVYYNGQFNWTSDYSWLASIDYHDTAGIPLSGATDIAVTILGQWGGFQPYLAAGFDTSPYKYLTFAV